MSSVPSPQHDRMLAQQRAHEPSMEEILASIRRIISDDHRVEPAAAQVEPLRRDSSALAPDSPANAAQPSPVLVRSPQPFAEQPPAPRVAAPVEWVERLHPSAPEPQAYEPAPRRVVDPASASVSVAGSMGVSAGSVSAAAGPVSASSPLVSRETDAAVSAQFGALADVMMSNNAQRLEDMTRQMLRPMLKAWLDDNLPILVEKLVRAEIERVARGGR